MAAGQQDTDAVNVSQLNQVAANQKTSSVKAGTNIASVDATTSGNNTEYTVNAKGTTVTQGDGIDLTTTDAGSNTTNYKVGLNQATKDSLAKADSALQTISSSNSNVVVSAKDASGNQSVGFVDNPTFAGTVTAPTFVTSGNNAVTVSGDTGTINGLTNKTFDPNAFTSGQAASEDQLAQVAQQASQKGSFNLTAQGNHASAVNNGDTVDLRNTDGNIAVSKDAKGNTVNFDLAKDINVNSVTAGNTKVDNNGVTINNGAAGSPVTLTSAGLNNGNNVITNVAAGSIDSDAVNVAQLKAAAHASTTKVTAGNNIVVTPTSNSDGSTTYNVATSMNPTFNTTRVGNVNIDGNKITGVAPGNITPNSTDVVNGSQLYATNQAVTQAQGDIKQAQGDIKQAQGNITQLQNGGAGVVQYSNAATPTTPNGGVQSNDVTIMGADTKAPVTIHNVAEGRAPTDAVNVGQLNGLANNVNNALNQMGYKINDVEDNANAGISAAMATAALPQAYLPGKSMLAGGMASYNGQSAAAVGVSKLSDNGRWVIKANGTADTQGNFGGAVGAGFHW